ncbi:hypothetical protein EU245_11605 [Lentibacillus lipolyticus]|nr:hypothetical protein EU245_11605 [Lentibacillus lipolyticus]
MGYVLPVNHYQYQDYQRRAVRRGKDPFHIEKPYKTIPAAKYDAYRDLTPEIDVSEAVSTEAPLPEMDAIYAELTGKGHHVDYMV